MPVGLAIGGAVAGIGGAMLGASAQKSAANTAARSAAENTAANNALAREFRADNEQNLDPFMDRGNVAGAYYNALLGLPGAEYTSDVAPNAMAPGTPGAPRPGMPPWANIPGGGQIPFWGPLYNQWNQSGGPSPGVVLNGPQGQYPGQPGQPGQATTKVNNVTAQNAFDTFRASTPYQFQLNEGFDALNHGYAAQGTLRSGAAQKGFIDYGQGKAAGAIDNYLGYLGGQQNVGLSAANALAGVGTTALNAMTSNNNNAADAAGNAALIRGNANANMWAQVGNGLGNVFGSSFGGGGSGGGGTNNELWWPSGGNRIGTPGL